MRSLAVCLLLVTATAHLALADTDVNGTLRDAGDHQVLHVWGTHEEMGYAQGRLLGEDIMTLANGYVLPMFGGAEGGYPMIRAAFVEMLEFPDEVVDEAEGIVEGIRDSGASLEMGGLDRDLDEYDLLLSNAAADLFGIYFGCSSISAWGSATQTDSALDGELAMARDLDWGYAGGEEDLRDFPLVIARNPSDPSMQPWVSIAFPGYVGCLSCFNVSGIGAFQNQGNTPTMLGELDTTNPPVPIHMTIRRGIEGRDLDGDGADTIHDVEYAVSDAGRLGTYEIHVISPVERSTPPAAIIEADNTGMVVRYPADDPLPASDCVAVTNHHRLLIESEACDRYDSIVSLVEEYGGELTLDRLWEAEVDASWDVGAAGTMQTMRVVPALLTLDVAFSTPDQVAPLNPITSYDIDSLFEGTLQDDGVDDTAGDDDDSADDGSGGCGCTTAGSSAAVPAALAALLALVNHRRRARRHANI